MSSQTALFMIIAVECISLNAPQHTQQQTKNLYRYWKSTTERKPREPPTVSIILADAVVMCFPTLKHVTQAGFIL